jgi:hypothetical protein
MMSAPVDSAPRVRLADVAPARQQGKHGTTIVSLPESATIGDTLRVRPCTPVT